MKRAILDTYKTEGNRIPAVLSNRDAQTLIRCLDVGAKLAHEPSTRVASRVFNLTSKANTNYFPAAMVQAAEGRTVHSGSEACTSCQNGNGPWVDCVTLSLEGHTYQKGACSNCVYSNHYEHCSFSGKSVPLLLAPLY